MADKKRSKKRKVDKFAREVAFSQVPDTYDDSLDRIQRETLAAVVKAECFPRGRDGEDDIDDTKVYYTRSSTERYEQDPYTVAQHMADRTQFRH